MAIFYAHHFNSKELFAYTVSLHIYYNFAFQKLSINIGVHHGSILGLIFLLFTNYIQSVVDEFKYIVAYADAIASAVYSMFLPFTSFKLRC